MDMIGIAAYDNRFTLQFNTYTSYIPMKPFFKRRLNPWLSMLCTKYNMHIIFN